MDVVATTQFTDEATAWGTLCLAAGTVILAGIGLRQARLTRDALSVSERDVREATKARIDQSSPRVTFTALMVEQACQGWHQDVVNPPGPWRMTQHTGVKISLRGWFFARNEGASTAVLDFDERIIAFPLEGDIKETDPHNLIRRTGFTTRDRPPPQPSGRHQAALRPGQQCVLIALGSRTLAEWVEMSESSTTRPPIHLEVLADDTFEEGIRDTTKLALHGIPVRPGDKEGEWVLNSDPSIQLEVVRTVRDYRLPPLIGSQPPARRAPWRRHR